MLVQVQSRAPKLQANTYINIGISFMNDAKKIDFLQMEEILEVAELTILDYEPETARELNRPGITSEERFAMIGGSPFSACIRQLDILAVHLANNSTETKEQKVIAWAAAMKMFKDRIESRAAAYPELSYVEEVENLFRQKTRRHMYNNLLDLFLFDCCAAIIEYEELNDPDKLHSVRSNFGDLGASMNSILAY